MPERPECAIKRLIVITWAPPQTGQGCFRYRLAYWYGVCRAFLKMLRAFLASQEAHGLGQTWTRTKDLASHSFVVRTFGRHAGSYTYQYTIVSRSLGVFRRIPSRTDHSLPMRGALQNRTLPRYRNYLGTAAFSSNALLGQDTRLAAS